MAYRFSGHESFPFRYTWLPKALSGIAKNPKVFEDEDSAMVAFGIGKNMVRSMRFWIEATGVAQPAGEGGLKATPVGQLLFGSHGVDPFLEDAQSLWVLHWNLSTHVQHPLFAWEYLLNRWQESEIAESAVLRAFAQESERLTQKKLSSVTIKQHFEIFLHTYLPARGRKREVAEDSLDCPLTELELLAVVGERETGGRRREAVFAFQREEKPSISPALFAWALQDFWQKRFPNEKSLPARSVAMGVGGPGQIFKLPEQDILTRLAGLERTTHGAIVFQESDALPQVQRNREADPLTLLRTAFQQSLTHA